MTQTSTTHAPGYRNVLVLAMAQALYFSAQSLMITVNGLVGAGLSETLALATIPVTAVMLGGLVTIVPASLLMRSVGRRAGFLLGTLCVVVGAGIAATAIVLSNFWLFVAGTFVIGFNNGFAQYYRFAAVDDVEPAFRPKAISLVLSGGVVAAFVGPNLARWSADVLPQGEFLGCFAVMLCLGVLMAGTLSLLRLPHPVREVQQDTGRPLRQIVAQPEFYVAALVGMVGYAVMSLIMTATPIAIVDHGMVVGDAATVISWHVLAMFAPALVMGSIVARFGVFRVMLAGTVMLAVCCVIAMLGVKFHHFLGALIFLGVGWCATYVSASTLLTESYRPEERAKVQAANDFLIVGSVALASGISGGLLHFLGWDAVQMAALPFVAAAAVAAIVMAASRRRRLPGPG